MPSWGPVSRRDALKVLGSGAATVSSVETVRGLSGSTRDGPVRVTVGYSGPAGERAARNRAHEVVYKFSFDAITVIVDSQDIQTLRRLNTVRYVERDGLFVITSQTLPWGIDRVDAEVVHADSDKGDRADIAIIDTGIDSTHEDLAKNLGEGTAFMGGQRHNQWQDDNGHGTHCAGIAAAIDNSTGVVGVAPSATLHAVKVMTSPGAGLSSDVAKGIEWTADQGYDVGSLSLGGDHLNAVADACKYAAGKGVTLVAAAGNDGPCTDCVTYPAAYPEVIAVSATTEDDNFANSSSQGPEVELAAPGDNIYSTYLGGYATQSGTSMACPHVSGTAAQLAAKGHSNDEIRHRLKESAENIGLSANKSGAGLLDVAAALGGDTGEDRSESASTETPTPTPRETASPTPAATDSSSVTGGGASSGNVSGSSSSSATPTGAHAPKTNTQTATPTQTEMQRTTTTPTQSPTASPTQPPTATPSPMETTPADREVDNGISLWRQVSDIFKAVIDIVEDALTSVLP